MSYDYSRLSATAKKLIDKFGRAIVKRTTTQSGSEFDPVFIDVDSEPFIGVFTAFSKSEIDGTLIKATDKKILTYEEVLITDKIVDDSIVYSVVNVDVVQPGATKIIFKVQVRI